MSASVSLRSLLDLLGPEPLTALAGGHALDRSVADVRLVDPLDADPVGADEILLAVGFAPTAADGLLRRACAGGATAVVLKRHDCDLTELAAVASAGNLTLLIAHDRVPWEQLLDLLRSGMESARGGAVGDLFALANVIAASLGGAVAIEDAHQRVLAYSNLPGQVIDDIRKQGILDRQVPNLSRHPDQYPELRRGVSPLVIPAEHGSYGRLATAVRAGTEYLGSIWVVDAGDLKPDAMQVLETASRAAALQMLRARAASDAERVVRADALRALLDGRASPELAAIRLGLDAVAAHVVVALEVVPRAELPVEMLTERVAELMLFELQARRQMCAVAVAGSVVYALVRAASGELDRLRVAVASVLDRAHGGLDCEVRGAIGSVAQSLLEVGTSRGDADRVLVALQRRGERLGSAEELREAIFLQELQRMVQADEALQLPVVRRIIDQDAQSGSAYAATLLAYLDAFADVAVAARAVSVHPNTFRYRIRRAKELSGVDLESADSRLVLWLQLQLLTR